ncbi:hypothetical protein [Bacillus thuringiensis]
MATVKEKSKEKETKRPRYKQLTMRKKENPSFVEWLDNQTDFSDSIRKLIEYHIMRHGTMDMNDPNVVLGMAKDLVLLDQFKHGQVVPAATQMIEEVSPIHQVKTAQPIEKEEIKEVVEEKVEIQKEETPKNEQTSKKIEERNVDLSDF